MNEVNDKLKLKKILDPIMREKKTNWSTCRDVNRYERKVIHYEFGDRIQLVPPDDAMNEMLQASRGYVFTEDEIDEQLERARNNLSQELPLADKIRIDELRKHGLLNDSSYVIELGFRFPKIQKYLTDRNIRCKGYDIASASVQLGKLLNFDVERFDLTDDTYPDMTFATLIVSYHVFEHIPDPLQALSKLHDVVAPGSHLHVEVPIQFDNPTIRTGHLFGFHPDDLRKMLELSGWKVISSVLDRTIGHSERCIAQA